MTELFNAVVQAFAGVLLILLCWQIFRAGSRG